MRRSDIGREHCFLKKKKITNWWKISTDKFKRLREQRRKPHQGQTTENENQKEHLNQGIKDPFSKEEQYDIAAFTTETMETMEARR